MSALLLKRHFSDVELITDDVGMEILIEKMELPYANSGLFVSVPDFSPKLGFIAKAVAIQSQKEPFIYVEHSNLLFQPDSEFFNKEVLVQRTQFHSNKIAQELLGLVKLHFKNIGFLNETNYDDGFYGFNLGILGGTNSGVLRKFSHYLIQMVKDNAELINKHIEYLHADYELCLSIIFEQLLFKLFMQNENVVPETFEKNEQQSLLDNLYHFPDLVTSVQLSRDTKQNLEGAERLAFILRRHYPEFYFRILKLIKCGAI